ncbi:hypothetical protein DAD186_08420 [Dermabacter vaginalis]|uniref:Uncharacterized protein n=1 Tax=Dermabacter vaginalis TaxID=1630135 RepID=A0A1B0ZHL7_9MICO|nr:hypothetical protein DAD186_08420 [Dermabacter vaginalis]
MNRHAPILRAASTPQNTRRNRGYASVGPARNAPKAQHVDWRQCMRARDLPRTKPTRGKGHDG